MLLCPLDSLPFLACLIALPASFLANDPTTALPIPPNFLALFLSRGSLGRELSQGLSSVMFCLVV